MGKTFNGLDPEDERVLVTLLQWLEKNPKAAQTEFSEVCTAVYDIIERFRGQARNRVLAHAARVAGTKPMVFGRVRRVSRDVCHAVMASMRQGTSTEGHPDWAIFFEEVWKAANTPGASDLHPPMGEEWEEEIGGSIGSEIMDPTGDNDYANEYWETNRPNYVTHNDALRAATNTFYVGSTIYGTGDPEDMKRAHGSEEDEDYEDEEDEG